MPTGQYERKPRGHYKVSEEWRAALRKNIRKAIAASNASEKAMAARAQNMKKVTSRRAACGILGRIPVGSNPGTVFKSGNRKLTVVDTMPVEREDGKWEQKFTQSGSVVLAPGIRKIFSGTCRIVWETRPTMADLTEGAIFVEDTPPQIVTKEGGEL